MDKPLYEIFSGNELKIAQKIQQRRLQMLVHSYIYYELDKNIVEDSKWAQWANELKELQDSNPSIAEVVPYAEHFKNWDASTGAFLPYTLPNIVTTAHLLLGDKAKFVSVPRKSVVSKPKKDFRKKLF